MIHNSILKLLFLLYICLLYTSFPKRQNTQKPDILPFKEYQHLLKRHLSRVIQRNIRLPPVDGKFLSIFIEKLQAGAFAVFRPGDLLHRSVGNIISDSFRTAFPVDCLMAVSYTHLDVYKRQVWLIPKDAKKPIDRRKKNNEK